MDSDPVTISVPNISGDSDGWLSNEIVYQLGSSGCFICTQQEGEYSLVVDILSDTDERIGFRYDRDNPSGKLEKNLLGVEDRRTLVANISLVQKGSGKVVIGPSEVSASVEYDYTDPGSPKDLLFAKKEPIMPFSLGQLDSQEGAQNDAARPLFRKLAAQIVAGLVIRAENL
jgi:hypothetical protein